MQLVGNDAQDLFPKWLDYHGVLITGTPHTAGLAEKPENFATALKPTEVFPHRVIQMIHGDLFNEYCVWPHQKITDIHPFITVDLVLSGHIHAGWKSPICIENPNANFGETVYINPGSIGRTSIGKIRPIRVVLIEVDEQHIEWKYITLNNVIKDPFVEKSDVLEGSPVTDFTQLMKLISTLELRQTDFKTHIPHVVEELCGDSPYLKQVTDRVYEALEQQKEH